jgi:hypothetical protein
MTVILALLGVVLVGFGALVLLKFPDRPGGKLAWRGFEVNSTGAGLPLIVLGVVTTVIAVSVQLSGKQPETPAAPGVTPGPELVTPGVPADRIVTLEDGTHDRDIVEVDQSKDWPIGVKFTQDGRPLGALTLQPSPRDNLFKVRDVVDAQNHPVAEYSNASRGGTRNVLQNWDTMHIRFEGRLYLLRVGGFDTIRVNFEQAVE